MKSPPAKRRAPNESHPPPTIVLDDAIDESTVDDDQSQSNPSINNNDLEYCCYHCKYHARSSDSVYRHWNKVHNTQDKVLNSFPFWFKIDKIVKCLQCNTECFISEAKEHHAQNHPTKELAITTDRDGKICSQCSYSSSTRQTLLAHFKITHSSTNTAAFDKLFITEPILDYLLTLYRQRSMCLLCMRSFMIRDDYVKHHQTSHQGESPSSDIIEVEGVTFSCNACRAQFNNEPQALEHMRHHFRVFMCNFCDSSFRYQNLVQKHHAIMHNSNDNSFRYPTVDLQVDKYMGMMLIFENGFVCKKADLINTKYGDVSKLTKTLEKWDERDLRLMGKSPRKLL